MSDEFIHAPWTAEQVDALNRFQRLGYVHEFTCPEHHDGANRALFATKDGWRCPHCDYRQDWAHPGMLDAQELADMIVLPCDVMLPPATVIRKGCGLGALMAGINARASFPPEVNRFDDPAARPFGMFDVALTVNANDYSYPGRLAGLAFKRSGAVRYVIEDENGRLFIHNANQIGQAEGWRP